MTVSDPRLPTHVVPSRYELELEPDLDAASFRGSVRIDVEILDATDEIVCHAAELDILGATVQLAHGDRRRIVPTSASTPPPNACTCRPAPTFPAALRTSS